MIVKGSAKKDFSHSVGLDELLAALPFDISDTDHVQIVPKAFVSAPFSCLSILLVLLYAVINLERISIINCLYCPAVRVLIQSAAITSCI